jgi:arylsulfatase A-like enzyme
MDEGIGRVMAALKAQGLDEQTLVVFTSDNGGERFSDNWPFVGQKMDLLEGGIRVPMVARWPGRIRPATTDALAITMDWSATMLAAAGVAPHPDYPLDGVDLSPHFAAPDPDAALPAESGRALYWRMLHRHQRAMRQGRWKYLKMDEHEYLFDVVRDARERANLATRDPDRLAAMRAEWLRWDAAMLAIAPDARVHALYGDGQIPRSTH